MKFTIKLTPDELDGGWTAECLELPGCVSDGDTEQEAMDNIAEAISGVLAVRLHATANQLVRVGNEPAAKARPIAREMELCVH
jgi:predicted RNase H-like HicB family nuclease